MKERDLYDFQHYREKEFVSGDLFQSDDLPLVEAFDRDPDPRGSMLRQPDNSIPAGRENIVC
jgi:hypothetical protein